MRMRKKKHGCERLSALSSKIGEVLKDECIKIKSTPKKCSVYTMGNINDIEALAHSSNVYQFKTAIRIGKGNYQYNQSLKI